MSRETTHIALTCTALNNLPVCNCDVKTSCLQDLSSEKHYVICGVEFGLENMDTHAIIVHAFGGGKCFKADCWRHIRSTMEKMRVSSGKGEPNAWTRLALKSNGV